MRDIRVRGFQGIPTVIKNLLIVNALVFFAQITFENSSTVRLDDWLALHDLHSDLFKFHQLFTYMFMHGGIGHIFFNMFALWMFGSELENVWGPKRFLLFYISCGVGAGLLHLGVLYYEFQAIIDQLPFMSPEDQQRAVGAIHYSTTVGASGSVFGCLAAFGYLFPNNVLYIYALFPIKAKWFVILYAAAELWMGVANSAGDNVAHWAHLGGALVGILMVIYWNKTNRRQFY
ncbi:rhomboid family intramembrane serine protease [Flavitalea antarctica]|jgi:membrane associated rhomboid family serine protease